MEQSEYLKQHIFTELKNLNDGFDDDSLFYFSETDFGTLLQRCEHSGIGIYNISSWLDGKTFKVSSHEDVNKKATDPRWYNKTFKTLRMSQEGLLFSASYKVSSKLLAR
ncbi:MAG: hypothetical protein ACI9SJ_000967 [Flavobacteriaceae bacterium]|jgi:hypothetical protein|uniref:hypothetical protein n=1 Tax=Candidatus Marifrigoribacter sp. Uisw_064 TaxID=3230970 RepID=UPI003ADF6D7B